MRSAVIIYLAVAVIIFLIAVATSPARAAMEPEEIMVRLATGLPLTSTPPRRKNRKVHHGYR